MICAVQGVNCCRVLSDSLYRFSVIHILLGLCYPAFILKIGLFQMALGVHYTPNQNLGIMQSSSPNFAYHNTFLLLSFEVTIILLSVQITLRYIIVHFLSPAFPVSFGLLAVYILSLVFWLAN